MKIIHVITAFGIGGAEKLLLNIMNKQVEDHAVFLVYFKGKPDLVSQLNTSIKVKQIPFSVAVIKNLKTYYNEIKPDVIHTHLGHADFIGIWAARSIKAKVFCTMHNIYFKKTFMDALFFRCYSFLFLKVAQNSQVISISKSVETHVLQKLKLPKERSHLLLNAIPVKEIKKVEKQHKKITLLFVGRL